MEILRFTLADEARVLHLLQPHLNNGLNPRRIPEWVTGKTLPASERLPAITKEAGGFYKRFLDVRGFPSKAEVPNLQTSASVHNSKRAVLPLAGFEIDYFSRKPTGPTLSVRPASSEGILLVAGTYDLKPRAQDPWCFYPQIVGAGGSLHPTSRWEPLFIEPHQVGQWLEPWFSDQIEHRGKEFGYLKLKQLHPSY